MADDELLMGTQTAVDSDGDGVSDVQERLDGTDALDAGSVSRSVDATLDGDPGAVLQPDRELLRESFDRGSMTAPEGVEVERGIGGVDGVEIDTTVDRGVDLGADRLGGGGGVDPLGLGGGGQPPAGGGGGDAPTGLVGGQDMSLVSGDKLDFLDDMPPEPGAPPAPPPETGGIPDKLPPPPGGATEPLPPPPMDMPPPDPGETPAPSTEPAPAPEPTPAPAPDPEPAPAPSGDDEDDTYVDADAPGGGTLTGDSIDRVLTTRGGNIDFDESGQAPLGAPANAPDLGLISNVDVDSAGSVGTTGGPGRPVVADPEVLPEQDGGALAPGKPAGMVGKWATAPAEGDQHESSEPALAAGDHLTASLESDMTAGLDTGMESPSMGFDDSTEMEGQGDDGLGLDDGFD